MVPRGFALALRPANAMMSLDRNAQGGSASISVMAPMELFVMKLLADEDV